MGLAGRHDSATVSEETRVCGCVRAAGVCSVCGGRGLAAREKSVQVWVIRLTGKHVGMHGDVWESDGPHGDGLPSWR